VADEQVELEPELIPDVDSVFLRVHKSRMTGGIPNVGAFSPKGADGLSVDWSRYSTAQDSRLRANSPKDNAVVRMVVRDIRGLEGSPDVVHAPITKNLAHSLVAMPSDAADLTQMRLKLGKIATIEIPLEL
jgi:hypothetical protein